MEDPPTPRGTDVLSGHRSTERVNASSGARAVVESRSSVNDTLHANARPRTESSCARSHALHSRGISTQCILPVHVVLQCSLLSTHKKWPLRNSVASEHFIAECKIPQAPVILPY